MMEMHKMYAASHQNEIVFLDSINDKKLLCTSHINYINNIQNNIIYSFSKMKFHHFEESITIEEIRDLFQSYKNKLNTQRKISLDQQNINSLSLSNLINNISYLIICFTYLQRAINGSFNVCNVTDYKKIKNIQDDFKNATFMENNELTNLIKKLNELTIEINQFINAINILKVSHFKILNFFKSIVNMQFTLIEKYPKCISMLIESILIDQNQDPILVLIQNTENESSINESLKSTIEKCLIEYQSFIEFIKIQPDIKNFICNEIEQLNQSIHIKLNGISKENQFDKQLNTFLNEEVQKFHILHSTEMQNDKIYFDGNKSADNYFLLLLNISKYHMYLNSENILDIFKSIFQCYESYLCSKQITHILSQITKLIHGTFSEENEINSVDSILIDFQKQIEKIQREDKYFYFELFFQTILKNLLNQKIFAIYHKLIVSDDDDDDDFIDDMYNPYFSICDLINFSSHIAYTQFVIDKEFNFCIEKIYNQNAKKEIIQREKNIFKENKSKFIVHLFKEINENKIVFPYFPLQSIYYCLFSQKSKIHFSLVDRIIIVKEIAIGMNDLNSMKQCHGNLSISSIFINSNKDAYIGEIAYDRYREKDLTKTPEKVIYRAPEIIESGDLENNILLSDIYSFGIIMYEILTGKSAQSVLRKKPRSQIYRILTEGIKNYIFSDDSNDNLNQLLFDIRGDSLIGAKEIIEKCLDKMPNERYLSFDEIIKTIENLAIYEKNKDEIEYRIENAKSASSYNCHLCDIVESNFQGNQQSSKVIEKAFINISNFLYSFNEKTFIYNGDIIESIYEYFGVKSNNDFVI